MRCNLREVRDKLVQERERLFRRVNSEVEYLEPFPSSANFILCRVHGRDAKSVKDSLATEHGIMVRYYDKPEELRNCFRISVGKSEHTDLLIDALKTK